MTISCTVALADPIATVFLLEKMLTYNTNSLIPTYKLHIYTLLALQQSSI